ncbi:putative nucleotidyltransferase substrate binding domain-containing protein [Thiomicrospira sp. WB1]|uniref:putative nucleotidyltransferase substrate binding domain-containing protein n=1 Tax=Thiomicrospira sp. WB1 TaxID=1685380 RepID=UPI0007466620|nr:putative nucleotidyltransferase substrate binding domain-containing protein [Thiomicrospira sp. WB1]KUJ71971.1 nucleotidyltransferase [Thiomicrospira sp. WB1]
MADQDTLAYLTQVLPFDRLNETELAQAADALDVVYFPQDAQIPLNRQGSAYLYLVIKGRVSECHQSDESAQCGLYGVHAAFGASSLLDQNAHLVYRALEETVAYRLPFSVFETLLHSNNAFEAFYFHDITQKLSQFHRQLQEESSSEAMMDAVSIAPLHALIEVNGATGIQACVEKMQAQQSDACVVHHHDQVGIVTASDLLRGLALESFDLQSPVGELATFPVITINQGDFLFNALLKMTRYGVDRLVVRDGQTLKGVLHQKELMSLFANQSGLVMLTLERAETFDDLKQVVTQIDQLVAGLSNKGVKTHYIAKLVNELHRKLQAKLWSLLDEDGRFDDVTYVVMGSEGRSEQVVRTDQDNAVIFPDHLSRDGLMAFCEHFNQKLIELGFPPCPGNIMLSNPEWCLSEQQWRQKLIQWFDDPSEDGFMALAILFDAQVVRGEAQRLEDLKEALWQQVEKRPMFLPHFALSVSQFETPIGLFGRLITQKDAGHSIDIKKGGIFPIVHGIRCLALEGRIEPTNTHWRIRKLMDAGVFSEAFGIELGETLNFLNTLRLQAMLHKKMQGKAVDNRIETDELSHFQQDLLKEAFGVVNQFKKVIEQHFKLENY